MTLSINLYLSDSNPKPCSFVHKVLSQCHLQQGADKVIYFVWLCILSYNLFIRIKASLVSKKIFRDKFFFTIASGMFKKKYIYIYSSPKLSEWKFILDLA